MNAAWGRETLTSGTLMLYDRIQTPGRYVLCANFQSSESNMISYVVIGDTFKVRSAGATCVVAMSNAEVLHTKYGRSPDDGLVQDKMQIGAWADSFPKDTKLLFENRVFELETFNLSKVENDATTGKGDKIYEGQAALDQLKKMGQQPPPDMDTNNINGH